jgi:nitrous oxidase accessory protein NosD
MICKILKERIVIRTIPEHPSIFENMFGIFVTGSNTVMVLTEKGNGRYFLNVL